MKNIYHTATNLDAPQVNLLIVLNSNLVNPYSRAVRERIAGLCEIQSPFMGKTRLMKDFSVPGGLRGERSKGFG